MADDPKKVEDPEKMIATRTGARFLGFLAGLGTDLPEYYKRFFRDSAPPDLIDAFSEGAALGQIRKAEKEEGTSGPESPESSE